MTKESKDPAVAPHDMWVYGPNDEPLLLAEGDEIPAGYGDAPSGVLPELK